MGLLHHKDDARLGKRFVLKEKLLSIGDDFWIEDEEGHHAYLVDGKALRLRDTWVLKDANRNEVAEIKERGLSVRDKLTVHFPPDGKATVAKRLIGIRDRFEVKIDHQPDLHAKGNFVDHEYEIERDDVIVARVSKKWLRVRDTYGVDISPLVNPVLVLAVVVAIDSFDHD